MHDNSRFAICRKAIITHLRDQNSIELVPAHQGFEEYDECEIDWDRYCKHYGLPDPSLSLEPIQRHYQDFGFWEGVQLSACSILGQYDLNGYLRLGHPILALDGWASLVGLTDKDEQVGARLLEAFKATQDVLDLPLSHPIDFLALGVATITALEHALIAILQNEVIHKGELVGLVNTACLGLRTFKMWERSIGIVNLLGIETIAERATASDPNAIDLLEFYNYYLDPQRQPLPYRGSVFTCPSDRQQLLFASCSDLELKGCYVHLFETPSIDINVPVIAFANLYDASSTIVRRDVKFKHRELFAVRIDQAKISPDGFVVVNNQYLLADDISNALPQRKPRRGNGGYISAIDSGSVVVGPIFEPIEKLNAQAVLLSSWIHQVGHFQIDTMPQLFMLDQLRSIKLLNERPSIVYRKIIEYSQDMVYAIYDMIFRTGDRYTLSNRFFLEVEELWVFNTPLDGRGKSVNATAYRHSKEQLDIELNKLSRSSDLPKKLFISRKDAQNTRNVRTRILNYPQFEDLLFKLGFHSCVMSELPVSLRIDLFRQADVVCGVHGSGLFNAVLMPQGSHVVDLQPPGGAYGLGLLSILSGLNYHACPTSIELVDGVDWSRIEIDYLASILESL